MTKNARIRAYMAAARELQREIDVFTAEDFQEGSGKIPRHWRTGICGKLKSPESLWGYSKLKVFPELDLFVPQRLLRRGCYATGDYWFGLPKFDEGQKERIICMLLCAEIARTSKK